MPPKAAQSSSSSQGGIAAGVNVKALEIGRHSSAAPSAQHLLLTRRCRRLSSLLLRSRLSGGSGTSSHLGTVLSLQLCVKLAPLAEGLYCFWVSTPGQQC